MSVVNYYAGCGVEITSRFLCFIPLVIADNQTFLQSYLQVYSPTNRSLGFTSGLLYSNLYFHAHMQDVQFVRSRSPPLFASRLELNRIQLGQRLLVWPGALYIAQNAIVFRRNLFKHQNREKMSLHFQMVQIAVELIAAFPSSLKKICS